MISSVRLLIFSSVVFAGCHTAQKVAVTGFHVIDAPAKFIRDRVDEPNTTTTTTTQTSVSDVSRPGEAVVAPSPTPMQHHVVTQNHAPVSPKPKPKPKPTPHPRAVATTTSHKTSPSASPHSASSQAAQFPTAKPVPGKPGYVYSVDPKGGIVDVTGYKSGDKAKDPYTQQIFIVP